MPNCLATGRRAGLFLRRLTRRLQAANTRFAGIQPACIEALEDRRLLSSTFFVATWGNDSSAGTVGQPFRTIQRAANVANWGDTVDIMAGTYHESVHPAHSGVTFQAYNNQSVTVSGADPVGNWSGYRGNIYQASMPWDLGEGNNQVFVNGQAINEARWPNSGLDLSHPTLAHAQGVSGGWGRATIYDSHLSGGWTGAAIRILPGEGWYAQTGSVVASGSGWLTFTYQSDTSYTQPRAGNGYFLYGKFQALDSPGEFFRDSSGHLYLWTPNSSSPNSDDIEVKRRDFAFDLSGDSNITIQNINLFAATIQTNSASSNFVLNHVNASYLSQFTWLSIGWSVPWDSGIELNGSNSTVENSTLAYSAGDGVYVNASGCRVSNNTIHDVDYSAGDSAAVRDFGNYATISGNLIYNAGRCGVIDRAYGTQVLSNTIHDVMLQTADGGGIYTINGNGGGGSQFAYNTIYNIHDNLSSPHWSWFTDNGIFLDNYSSGFSIHDNSIWNTDAAVKLNYTSRNNRIYNNSLQGSVGSVVGNGVGDWNGTAVYDNTLYSGISQSGGGASMWGNSSARGGFRPLAQSSYIPTPLPVPPSGSTSSNSGSAGVEPVVTPVAPAPVPATSQVAASSYALTSAAQVNSDGSVGISGGAWLKFSQIDFGKGVKDLRVQLAAATAKMGLRIEVRLDRVGGKLLGTIQPSGGRKASAMHLQTVHARRVTGVHDLFFVFIGHNGAVDLSWFAFDAVEKKQK